MKIKNVKSLVIAAAACIFMGSSAFAFAAENCDQETRTYKFNMLGNKISALSVSSPENAVPTSPAGVSTVENSIVTDVNGVKVIKTDLEKAGSLENLRKTAPRKTDVFVENRLRWEQNGYKTNGGNNANNSGVMNRTRLNIKMNLSENATANFSTQKTADFGSGANDKSEPVNHANVVVDLNK